MRDAQNILIAVGRRFESYFSEFLLIRGLFLLFLFNLIELLFGRVLASVCEAHLRICVKGRQTPLLNIKSVKFTTNVNDMFFF